MFLLSRWSGGLVSRYGARRPLSFGPLIVAAGFILIALPSIGKSYWTAFFPAIVVLGFGMAVTVAPLTTVVMASVSQDRAGTASGVNNAVARVAGVLAIAVLGIIMVSAFSSRLNQSLAHLSLPPGVANELHANVSKLAGLPVPSGVDSQTASTIQRAIGEAFLFGFRITMGICVGLALASAWIARRMIQ